ncbi:MAG TPA: carboxypeptidase-like regulatory domain-containing protein [Vicinamibacterales bacterium]|nr:carboxypeptidase-like regulatory domain-containing protein [Vicinamibacterales bacterium]
MHSDPNGLPERPRRRRPLGLYFVLAVIVAAAAIWSGVATYRNYQITRAESLMTISTPRSFMLSGRVTESAPTTNVGLPGVDVQAWAGTRQVTSAKSDAEGHYYLQGLTGNIQLRVSAPGYIDNQADLLAFRDQNMDLTLTPEPKTIDQTLTGQVKSTDPQCYLIHACQVYTINAHHDGPIDATLTWPDEDVYLMLQLFVPATGRIITQGEDLFVAKQAISASLDAGTRYQLRVVYENGSKPTTFTLVTTHPN